MTERVTIDVDPGIVADLRRAGQDTMALNVCNSSVDRRRRLHALADAIEAALPMPEPAPGSVVRLPNGSVYGRASDRGVPWVRMVGRGGFGESWDYLRHQCATLVFDGATLEGPQDAPRDTHSHEQGEAAPECQTGPAGRSEAHA